MGKIIKVGRWVPHELTDRQEENHKIVCEMLLVRYKRNSYLPRIVTGDEKWIYFENPKRNRSYVDPGQPSKSTARPNRFGRKTMLCIFWDQEGPIYYMSFSNPAKPMCTPPLITTTPHKREDVSALDRFNVHRCPTRRVFSGTGLELVTRQATVRYLYHSATSATGIQVRRRSNLELYKIYKQPDIVKFVKLQSLKWAGHLARMNEDCYFKKIFLAKPMRNKPRGRPR
ncbi:mariner Mos1 transposase [Trichonephila clavipes]|nr:mariner Mos1 transposase [Trichonephila clavipes]